MTDPFLVVAAVYEAGDFDLTRVAERSRFVEACARALAAWDVEGLWGHVADPRAPGGHASDRLQSLAGRTIGMFQIIDDGGRPTFEWKAPPDGWKWWEEI